MKEIYKDTFIYKVCDILKIDLKELAFKMNKHYKTMENWRKDESSIPQLDKEYLKLLMQNELLKKELKSLEKHKVYMNMPVSSTEFGGAIISIGVKDGVLKRLTDYRVILEEI